MMADRNGNVTISAVEYGRLLAYRDQSHDATRKIRDLEATIAAMQRELDLHRRSRSSS